LRTWGKLQQNQFERQHLKYILLENIDNTP